MCLLVCRCAGLSVCPSVCLSVCRLVCPLVCRSVCRLAADSPATVAQAKEFIEVDAADASDAPSGSSSCTSDVGITDESDDSDEAPMGTAIVPSTATDPNVHSSGGTGTGTGTGTSIEVLVGGLQELTPAEKALLDPDWAQANDCSFHVIALSTSFAIGLKVLPPISPSLCE